MNTTRKSYIGARFVAVVLAVIIIGPLFPRDLYNSWLSNLWGFALGFAAGQVGQAVARINEEER